MQSIRTNPCTCHIFASQLLKNTEICQDYDTTSFLNSLNFRPFYASSLMTPFVCMGRLPRSDSKSFFGKLAHKLAPKSSATLARYALYLGVLSLLAMPAKELFAESRTVQLSKLDEIMSRDELVVATVAGDSTVFSLGDLMHGFGYDVVRQYADNLGVRLRLDTYPDESGVALAIRQGKADMTLGVVQGESISVVAIACDANVQASMNRHGLNAGMGFGFLAGDGSLSRHAQAFLCNQEQRSLVQSMARFYDQNLLKNDYTAMHFERAMNERLPKYKTAFQDVADKYNHDWKVLAAISYQESHLNPEAISRTGVQGLMMLTNDTAKAMGVKNRTNVQESIYGGAKYLEVLENLYTDVPESERLWFVLASYNMGPNAVKRIQSELATRGKNSNNWLQFYEYLASNASKNGRYVQCMHYVTNIRTYLETIKTMQV